MSEPLSFPLPDRASPSPLTRRLAGALLCTLGLLAPASPSIANPFKRDVARPGNEAYSNEDYEKAASEYVKAQDLEPLSAGLDFNLGGAYYRQEDFPRALESFEKATRADDPKMSAAAFYNLGNARYKSSKGDFEAAVSTAGGEEAAGGAVQDYVKRLEECIKDYEEALKRTPDDEDSKFNIETIRREIKNLMRRQESENQQNEQDQEQQDQEPQEDRDPSEEQQQEQSEQSQEAGEEEEQDPSDQQEQQSEASDAEQQESSAPEETEEGTPTPEPQSSQGEATPTPAEAGQSETSDPGPTPAPTLSISEEMARNLLDNLPEQRPRTRQQREKKVEKDW